MALTQIGFLGRTGPIFYDDALVAGKKVLIAGELKNGAMRQIVKQPAFAGNLGLNASEYALGTYTDNQDIGALSSWKQPANVAFDGFDTNVSAMVPGTTTAPGLNNQTGTTTTTSTTAAATSNASGTTTDTTFSAPTIGEQIQTFLTNYWWVVLILAILLLWKPVIEPALNGGKRKRRFR